MKRQGGSRNNMSTLQYSKRDKELRKIFEEGGDGKDGDTGETSAAKELKQVEKYKEILRKEGDTKDYPAWMVKKLIKYIFEDPMYYEVFLSRCHDINEVISVEKAKFFKEEINQLNKNNADSLKMNSLKLGVNAITSLCNHAKTRGYDTINLADNAISNWGMHAIKSLIAANCCKSLNLASNMISDQGLEMIINELTKNTTLEKLDLGVWGNSIRKNSLGISGAKCIAALFIHNKHLKVLKLRENDVGVKGAEVISQALKQNKTLRGLKIAENDIQSDGAEFILKSNFSLEWIDLGKNRIGNKVGPTLQYFIDSSTNLKKLNLEYNDLQLKGVEYITAGIVSSKSLVTLNLTGNGIGDSGLKLL